MATKLKPVPTAAPFAAALVALDALRSAVATLTKGDADNVDLRLTSVGCMDNGRAPAIALTITLKPFLDTARTAFKLESGLLTGYGVMDIRSSRESMSSSRRIVTAIIVEDPGNG